MRRATSEGAGRSGRWLRYAVGLPVAFKLGLDLGNIAPTLQSHYLEEERVKTTDVWNEVGEQVVSQLKSNAALQQHVGETAVARMQVSDVVSISKDSLHWRFFTRSPSHNQEKHEQWWDAVTDFRVIMATEELQLRVPLKSRYTVNNKSSTADYSLLINTHNDGHGWKVSNAWVETQGENASCVPLIGKQ